MLLPSSIRPSAKIAKSLSALGFDSPPPGASDCASTHERIFIEGNSEGYKKRLLMKQLTEVNSKKSFYH
ncbi:CLUMA_CG008416, isoform A [Clunio marinus]|uniref:CLUMA_CG008416, isoform A n=1 Tax=Clunio marinus TaxID=568069 RepID=A0A1J1I3Q5_9DIPT|nr:CLUMA_CG008416, isoform A [Clunio marinus]